MKRSVIVFGSDSGLRPWKSVLRSMPQLDVYTEAYSTLAGLPSAIRAVRRRSRDADGILAVSTLVGTVTSLATRGTPVVAMDIGVVRAVEDHGFPIRLAREVLRPLRSALALTSTHAEELRGIAPPGVAVFQIHQPAVPRPGTWKPEEDPQYFVCAGSSGRDLALLSEAAKSIPFEIRLIFGGRELVSARGSSLPQTRPTNLVLRGRTSLDDYYRELAGATALVHPLLSSRYPVGLTVLLDAMSMGVPVIAADVSSVREYQAFDTPGRFAPGDAAALSDLIRRAATDSAWTMSLSTAGRHHAMGPLSPAMVALELSTVLSRVLS